MLKASPLVLVPGFELDDAVVENFPGDFGVGDFISIHRQYAHATGGFAEHTTALIPNFPLYDQGRLSFSTPSFTGFTAEDTPTLELLGITAEEIPFSLGRSVYDEDGDRFPDIVFDITPASYYLRVASLGGVTNVSVQAFIQGFYRAARAATT